MTWMNAIRSQRPTEMGAPAGWSECHQKTRRLVDAHGDGLLVHTLAVLDRPSPPGFRALHRAWHEKSVSKIAAGEGSGVMFSRAEIRPKLRICPQIAQRETHSALDTIHQVKCRSFSIPHPFTSCISPKPAVLQRQIGCGLCIEHETTSILQFTPLQSSPWKD